MSQPNDILQFSHQADIYHGSFQLVRKLDGNLWLARHLEPTDEEIALIESDDSPYAPDHETEILERIDEAGSEFQIRIVTREEYARHF